MSQHFNTLLCLGDSYTIGEGVPLHESFPYQLVQILRKNHLHFHAPEIVAKTGWTTFELANHLLHTQLNPYYDFVTLLIGVNNQYRGLSIDDYKAEFEFLLKKAIFFAHHENKRVMVLSIPDWGVTPFAAEKDTHKIEKEIDAFNAVAKQVSELHQTHFIDITQHSRLAKNNKEFLAADGLHYSAFTHNHWAQKVYECIKMQLK